MIRRTQLAGLRPAIVVSVVVVAIALTAASLFWASRGDQPARVGAGESASGAVPGQEAAALRRDWATRLVRAIHFVERIKGLMRQQIAKDRPGRSTPLGEPVAATDALDEESLASMERAVALDDAVCAQIASGMFADAMPIETLKEVALFFESPVGQAVVDSYVRDVDLPDAIDRKLDEFLASRAGLSYEAAFMTTDLTERIVNSWMAVPVAVK